MPHTKRVTVRWSEDMIRHLSTEGRTMDPGESIRVAAGLPEDARIVAVELNPPSWPESVAFVFETKDTDTVEEVRVEHSVEFRHGKIPVTAIEIVAGCVGKDFVEEEEAQARSAVLRWLDSLQPAERQGG